MATIITIVTVTDIHSTIHRDLGALCVRFGDSCTLLSSHCWMRVLCDALNMAIGSNP